MLTIVLYFMKKDARFGLEILKYAQPHTQVSDAIWPRLGHLVNLIVVKYVIEIVLQYFEHLKNCVGTYKVQMSEAKIIWQTN